MVYVDFKGLARKIASHKVLRLKASDIAKFHNMMNVNEVLHLRFINFGIKRLKMEQLKIKLKKINN